MEHFVKIVQALEKLANEGNVSTKKNAFQLYSAVTRPVFIIATCIISKYSAYLEPVVNKLQSKSLDIFQCSNHIKKILSVVKTHRENTEAKIAEIYTSAKNIGEAISIELQIPRITGRQQHRSNPPATSDEEYWMRSLLIPYLDSFTLSLETRFADSNLPAFNVLSLHPSLMLDIPLEKLNENMKIVSDFYGLNGIEAETELWHTTWAEKELDHVELKSFEMVEVIREAMTFFPVTKQALLIGLAQPCSTSTVERSFSTLRRVKTWTRSTMSEDRLNGLCLMSVHRKLVLANKDMIEKDVVQKFAQNPRRLML